MNRHRPPDKEIPHTEIKLNMKTGEIMVEEVLKSFRPVRIKEGGRVYRYFQYKVSEETVLVVLSRL